MKNSKIYLEELRRERALMLPNLAPDLIKLKNDPSFKLKVEFFTLKHKEAVRNHQKISELKGVKAMKKMVNSTMTLQTGSRKVAKRRAEAFTSAKLERPASYYLHETVGKAIEFNPKDKMGPALFDAGCITCGKDNIATKYHGERHVCLNCRNQIKTYDGDEAKIYLDQFGNIVCKGVKNTLDEAGNVKKIFYDVPSDQMKVYEYRCYATFSGRDELIVLLHHDQTMRRKKEVRSMSRNSMNSSPLISNLNSPTSMLSGSPTSHMKMLHTVSSDSTIMVSNFKAIYGKKDAL